MITGEIKMNKLTLKELQTKTKMLDLVLQEKIHESISDTVSVYYEDILYDGKETSFYLFVNDKFTFNAVTYPSQISKEDIVLIAKDMIDQYRNSCDLQELDWELKREIPCAIFKKNNYTKCNQCPKCMVNTSRRNSCIGVTYSLNSNFDSYKFKNITFKNKWTSKYGENSEYHKKFQTKKLCNEIWNFSHTCSNDDQHINSVIKSLFDHCDKDKLKKVFKNIANY